jgi:hypothetical protein
MSSTPEAPGRFPCPACGQMKTWNPQAVGKRAKCGCGHILVVPMRRPGTDGETGARTITTRSGSATATAPPRTGSIGAGAEAISRHPHAGATVATPAAGDADEDGLYSIKPAEAAAARPVPRAVAAEPEQAIHPAGVAVHDSHANASRGPALGAIPYRKGLQPEPAAEEPPPSALRNVVLPVLLILMGVALACADGVYRGPSDHPLRLHQAIGSVSLNAVAGVALVVMGVLGASAMGGVAFQDSVPVIILKLCAIALPPTAIGGLLSNYIGDVNGAIASTFSAIALYFALFKLLFRLPAQDTIVCVLLIWIIRAGVAYLIFRFQGAAAGSSI